MSPTSFTPGKGYLTTEVQISQPKTLVTCMILVIDAMQLTAVHEPKTRCYGTTLQPAEPVTN